MIGWMLGLTLAFAQEAPPEDTVMVIVSARDLYQGVVIAEEDLYAVEIPPRYLPEGVFLSPDHVVGRVPHMRILANEFINIRHLETPAGRDAGGVEVGQRLIELAIAPTQVDAEGTVTLVGPAACLVAADVVAQGARVFGGKTILKAVLAVEDLSLAAAVAASGKLRIARGATPRGAKCTL